MGGVIKGAENLGKDAVNGVEHGVSSAAHTVSKAASSVAGDVKQGASNVAGAASSAAHGLFDAGKSAFTSVKNVASEASSAAQDGAHLATTVGNDIGHVAGSAVHGVEHLANGAKHDVKEGLMTATSIGDKLGVGGALDKLGLGGVNQENIEKNHHITDTYTRQSKELQQMLGPDSGANWATFASWASNRAGQAIANQDDPGGRTGRDLNQIGAAIPSWAYSALGPVGSLFGSDAHNKFSQYDRAYQQESIQAAKGNQKVFADISPPMQSFIDTFKGEKSPNATKWNQFESGLKQQGKSQELIDGLHQYYNAMFQSGDAKAQSITAGNLLIGLHEQQYLQPNIQAAFPPGQGKEYTGQAAPARIGSQAYNLAQDLPRDPVNHGGNWAPQLQNITNPELKKLVEQYGPSSGTLQGTGAADWTNLNDRMRFITGLFMSRYSDPSLFQNPRAS
ncbi:MAG: hypothetical protein ACYCW6_08240 [Candidatus Xenobia bacterium]